MRLFTALWPGPAASAELDALLRGRLDPACWRTVDPARRHVTLCFHGDDADPDAEGRRLRAGAVAAAAAGLWLRCAGVGRFGDALWVGVEAADNGPAPLSACSSDRSVSGSHNPDPLRRLAVAAGADDAGFVPHLTVARRRRGPEPGAIPAGLDRRGPWWPVGEVALVASGGRGAGPYRVLDRVVPGCGVSG